MLVVSFDNTNNVTQPQQFLRKNIIKSSISEPLQPPEPLQLPLPARHLLLLQLTREKQPESQQVRLNAEQKKYKTSY